MIEIKNNNWQKQLQNNITTAQGLADRGIISPQEVDRLQAIIDTYPMSITEYYLNLIRENNDTDPIYKMSIASLYEGLDDGSFDTSGEAGNTIMDGIQHKYDNTALLLSTNICAMYCRHCFRKRLVGTTDDENLRFIDKAIEYISSHQEIDNVLITGGDALLNNNKIIRTYLSKLSVIPHVRYIRFGTRTPVVMPSRISGDNELLDILEEYSKKKTIYIVTQFNHPNEFTNEAMESTRMLRQKGIPILNQTVLLAGVNDNPDVLSELFNSLVENGITPYYLFQCRPVKGVKSYFSIPLLQAVDIVDETKSRLSGVAKRFKFSMSHITGKIEIIGKTVSNKLILKQHQAKDNIDLNKMFVVEVREDSHWLPSKIEYKLL